MSGVSAGQRAVELPWLRPSDEALLALTADPPDRTALLRDPGLVAHLLRFARPTPDPADGLLTPAVLGQPGLCESAAALLDQFPRPSSIHPRLDEIATVAAHLAADLAADIPDCSPDVASSLARLAPLGWYAVGAVEPELVRRCLGEIDDGVEPSSAQHRLWGLDAAAVARRLVGRWRLPTWAAGTLGFLRLPPTDAARVGAPDGLFRVVRVAVAAAERLSGRIGLTTPGDLGRDAFFIRAAALADSYPLQPERGLNERVPAGLLVRLLRATAAARRGTGAVWLAAAEERIDGLASNLCELRDELEAKVRDAKLSSMAEFAAGASHEINNPLAVISGHAQMLLANEADPVRQKQLGAIIRQTKRVHELLQGTLQFARPPKPAVSPVYVAQWLAETVAAHRPDAEARGVTLEQGADSWPPGAVVRADAHQLRQALAQLVRNAIDAAPRGGWVRLTAEARGDCWAVLVEDSGPGPAPEQVDHLFDPFYSGRSAGRGTGLGLSIAWRLARLNGGDVWFEPTPGGPTRFVLLLPHSGRLSPFRPERRSA